MTPHLDCIVAGLGAAGSAALHHLALRGARVTGIDANSPPHTAGSSHGETRMIREAYFEDPGYVPLVRRAYELWHALEAGANETLIEETAGVYTGMPDDELVPGMLRAGTEHRIPLAQLSDADRRLRYAWLQPGPGMLVVVERRAGLLHPERCITAHLESARSHGATIQLNTPMRSWSVEGRHVSVETAAGVLTAKRLILATGAWMTRPLAEAGVTVTVARQPLFWFSAQDAEAASTMPVWAVEFEKGRLLYGFPDRGRGLKVAIHDPGVRTTVETVDRTVSAKEAAAIRKLAERYLPGVFGNLLYTATCMYTNAPDGHFIIDTHPQHDNVLLVSACSGHGFKFASAIGEAAAEWMLEGRPALDLSRFSLRRFDAAPR